MRIRHFHAAFVVAGSIIASPALAEDYPLPVLSAVAYSESVDEAEWEGRWDGEGEVVEMDDIDYGEVWRSGESGDRRIRTVVRSEPAPLPPLPAGDLPRGGDRPLGYGEGERQAWLAECRARMGRGQDYGVDACADYLVRYESGAGSYGYDYSYGAGQTSGHGCGCGCGSCGGGCGNGSGNGGCGCNVSYRFAPMPVMPVVQQRQSTARRIITTEEWEEEVPGKTVRIVPAPRPVPTKLVPVAPAPVKTVKPRYAK